jgi:hypothetical protein
MEERGKEVRDRQSNSIARNGVGKFDKLIGGPLEQYQEKR